MDTEEELYDVQVLGQVMVTEVYVDGYYLSIFLVLPNQGITFYKTSFPVYYFFGHFRKNFYGKVFINKVILMYIIGNSLNPNYPNMVSRIFYYSGQDPKVEDIKLYLILINVDIF